MPSLVDAANLLRGAANAMYGDAFANHYKNNRERLAGIVELGLVQDKANMELPYLEPSPHPRRHLEGQPQPQGMMGSRYVSMKAEVFGLEITIREADLKFDLTKTIEARVAESAEKLALLPERIAFQFMRGATDANLWPFIPTAPDGGNLYATTDGAGAARYGITGGNKITGAGVATANAVIGDVMKARGRVRGFLEPGTSQPLFDADSMLDGEMVVVAGAHNERVLQESFEQTLIQGTAAAPSNIAAILLKGKTKVWLTPRIPPGEDDLYVFFKKSPKAALLSSVAKGDNTVVFDPSNNLECRRERKVVWSFDCHIGAAIGEPYGTVQVDN